jgi:hypothetical protein
MALVYSDTEPYTGPPIRIDSMDPHAAYRKHLENWYFLRFIQLRGTRIERAQATRELAICDRKLAFWSRHHAFVQSEQMRITDEVKGKWYETQS